MSASKNRGLGKGLEALFGGVEIAVGDRQNDESPSQDSVSFVDIHEIKPNKNQPRKSFSEEKIEELAKSIEEHGIIQPIVLRRSGSGYEIVAGERRWRAARKAGLKEVPCLIRELTDEQNALMALIENMQREDLNPIEEAMGLSTMISDFGLTQEEVSKSIGKSRPYIANCLRLLKLPEPVQQMVIDGRLTSGHARAIAGIKNSKEQVSLAEKCIEQNWTVRDIEAYTKDSQPSKKKKKAEKRPKNRDLLALEEELRSILGTKVNIVLGSKKGKIEIEYFSREELERLLELLLSLK
ncbi:MAG: ParB/RepB/Spo0J family partition protein [Anaerovoracaceae bacterium]|jgi:ParB family chromosome partitioning protein